MSKPSSIGSSDFHNNSMLWTKDRTLFYRYHEVKLKHLKAKYDTSACSFDSSGIIAL
jgi:hypothetical protein